MGGRPAALSQQPVLLFNAEGSAQDGREEVGRAPGRPGRGPHRALPTLETLEDRSLEDGEGMGSGRLGLRETPRLALAALGGGGGRDGGVVRVVILVSLDPDLRDGRIAGGWVHVVRMDPSHGGSRPAHELLDGARGGPPPFATAPRLLIRRGAGGGSAALGHFRREELPDAEVSQGALLLPPLLLVVGTAGWARSHFETGDELDCTSSSSLLIRPFKQRPKAPDHQRLSPPHSFTADKERREKNERGGLGRRITPQVGRIKTDGRRTKNKASLRNEGD